MNGYAFARGLAGVHGLVEEKDGIEEEVGQSQLPMSLADRRSLLSLELSKFAVKVAVSMKW